MGNMPKTAKKGTKKGAVSTAAAASSSKNSLFERRPRNYGIGGDIQPKRNLGRFVKWPKYIRLQRQLQVLKRRLRVPPSINQFNSTLDKNTATQLFRLLEKYRPEDKKAKRDRLRKAAAEKAASDSDAAGAKPVVAKFGLNHVTALVEQKKAQLVIIAHDVDPIEVRRRTFLIMLG